MLLTVPRAAPTSRCLREQSDWSDEYNHDTAHSVLFHHVQGRAVVAGFTKVKVPGFNRKEMNNCINYYIHEKWLSKGTYNVITMLLLIVV